MQLKNFLAAAICTADTRLRRGVFLLLSIIVLPLIVASCAWLDDGDPIFEYPHDGGIDPTLVTVNLTYHCCSEIPLYQVVTLTKANLASGYRRYTYAILSEEGEVVKEGHLERDVDDYSDIRISFSLPSGEYRAVMWQDFTDNAGAPFYDASSLNAVRIRDAASYVGCTDLKDASWNITNLSIPESGEWNKTIDYEAILERPLSKIRFVSTDGSIFIQRCAEYLKSKSGIDNDNEQVKNRIGLVFSYEGYILTRFNATLGEFRNSSTGYSFAGELTETDKPTDLLIGTDYVFVNGEEGVYTLKLKVIDNLDGHVIEETKNIRVPVRRGHETIVTGDILTMYWGQGVSIDPEFSGEFDYVIK